MDDSQIYEKVQEAYSAAVKGNSSEYGHKVAAAFGYSKEELASIPKGASLGLSCGNPFALAKLREVHFSLPFGRCSTQLRDCHASPKIPFQSLRVEQGETVVDLGSGAGFDVFLAAQKVGRQGKAIGIDMNKVLTPFKVPASRSRDYTKHPC